MKERTLLHRPAQKYLSVLAILAATGACGVSGCASNPQLEEDLEEFRREVERPAPRRVQIAVVCEKPTADQTVRRDEDPDDDKAEKRVRDETFLLFGSSAVWAEDIISLLRELDVCTEVRTPAATDDEQPPTADMYVEVRVSRLHAPSTEINGGWATLDALTALIFPPGAWWIDDVRWDPGLEIELRVSLETGRDVDDLARDEMFDVRAQETSLRRRQPFASWSTLGAVFLPSFIFYSADPEHVAEALGGTIRREVALKVARAIRQLGHDDDLFKDLYVDADTKRLILISGPHLKKVVLYPAGTKAKTAVLSDKDDRRLTYRIPENLWGSVLRLEAIDDRGDSEFFSIRLLPQVDGESTATE